MNMSTIVITKQMKPSLWKTYVKYGFQCSRKEMRDASYIRLLFLGSGDSTLEGDKQTCYNMKWIRPKVQRNELCREKIISCLLRQRLWTMLCSEWHIPFMQKYTQCPQPGWLQVDGNYHLNNQAVRRSSSDCECGIFAIFLNLNEVGPAARKVITRRAHFLKTLLNMQSHGYAFKIGNHIQQSEIILWFSDLNQYEGQDDRSLQ